MFFKMISDKTTQCNSYVISNNGNWSKNDYKFCSYILIKNKWITECTYLFFVSPWWEMTTKYSHGHQRLPLQLVQHYLHTQYFSKQNTNFHKIRNNGWTIQSVVRCQFCLQTDFRFTSFFALSINSHLSMKSHSQSYNGFNEELLHCA